VTDELQRAAAAQSDSVLRRFFDPDGRLTAMPAKQSRKLAVFDLIVQRFVPGVRYTELEINRELMQLYDDYVSLRRGLVDFGMLDRADGWYWRSGGSVDIGSSGDIGTRAVDRAERAVAVDADDPPRTSSPIGPTLSARGAARREAIVAAAAELFAENGYAAVGMDDIGAAAGVTGPAIYRHFEAKAAVLTEVFDRIISTVDTEPDPNEVPLTGPGGLTDADPARRLRRQVERYAAGVSRQRQLMAVFVREVHHLPPDHRDRLRNRQRALVGRWRRLLAGVHPEWSTEEIRTAVHGVFGMLNTVGTFESPLANDELADVLADLAMAAFQLPPDAPS
jgi:AcrR family transcriptional regulator